MKAHDKEAKLEVTEERLVDDGAIPNSSLPLLLYPQAFPAGSDDLASTIEETFRRHGWQGTWRNGIYPYHHYHSTAHEVLGCYAGSGRVQFGGEHGVIRTLRAGDVVIIPAGVGHKNLGASGDFGVVGAYPAGQDYDMNYGRPGERPAADRNIERVPLPESDPVLGREGPLLRHWSRA